MRLRYQGAAIGCRAGSDLPSGDHDGLMLALDREVPTPAPGQIACLMRGEQVVGWALIVEPEADGGGLSGSSSKHRSTSLSRASSA